MFEPFNRGKYRIQKGRLISAAPIFPNEKHENSLKWQVIQKMYLFVYSFFSASFF